MFHREIFFLHGLPWWLRRERICLQCRRHWFDLWVGRIPWGREWQPAPAFLPMDEFYGWSSLVGYSPKVRKESDTTEWLTCIHTCTHAQSLRCVQLCDLTGCSPPASPSMEFPRQERWSAVPFLSAGDLPNPGIEPTAPVSWIGRQILYCWVTWEALYTHTHTHTHTHFKFRPK